MDHKLFKLMRTSDANATTWTTLSSYKLIDLFYHFYHEIFMIEFFFSRTNHIYAMTKLF